MKLINESEGVKLFSLDEFKDVRGVFLKLFNNKLFRSAGLPDNYEEVFITISKKNVIRGMHFQLPPSDHDKVVILVRGAIRDVLLDLRKGVTYGRVHQYLLDRPMLLFVPKGLAHGFRVLEEETMVCYLTTKSYDKEQDVGIRWDSFDYDWELDGEPILSDRDRSFPSFEEFKSPF